jgi:hypothetical protein
MRGAMRARNWSASAPARIRGPSGWVPGGQGHASASQGGGLPGGWSSTMDPLAPALDPGVREEDVVPGLQRPVPGLVVRPRLDLGVPGCGARVAAEAVEGAVHPRELLRAPVPVLVRRTLVLLAGLLALRARGEGEGRVGGDGVAGQGLGGGAGGRRQAVEGPERPPHGRADPLQSLLLRRQAAVRAAVGGENVGGPGEVPVGLCDDDGGGGRRGIGAEPECAVPRGPVGPARLAAVAVNHDDDVSLEVDHGRGRGGRGRGGRAGAGGR